jgi:tagatose 6-phosphate kinase
MFSNSQYPYDIVIVSPNGALDSYYMLPDLQPASVNRATRVFHTAGGKGHNMARAATRLGGRVLSIGIVGGDSGRFIEKELAREGIDYELVWADIETRRCLTLLVEGRRDTTVVLEAGQAVGQPARNDLTQRVLRRAHEAPFVVMTGSLPPDFPSNYYAGLVEALSASVTKVCIDSAGETLRLAAQAGPFLVKVNRAEFCLAFGESNTTFSCGLVKEVYADLGAGGLKVLIVTDGANGAYVMAVDHKPFQVKTLVDSWESTAGAGDTFMAGLLLALSRGETLEGAAIYASAAAAANLQQVGCGFFDTSDVARFLKVTSVREWA